MREKLTDATGCCIAKTSIEVGNMVEESGLGHFADCPVSVSVRPSTSLQPCADLSWHREVLSAQMQAP